MIDPAWEKIHSSRDWFTFPQEQMWVWLSVKYLHNKDAKVLDLGCGQGSSAFWIAYHGLQVVAVDGSSSAIAGLEKRLKLAGASAELVCSDISKIDYPDGYFDVVIDVCSISCNDNYQEIFDE